MGDISEKIAESKRVTIKDIAQHAGVAVSTVSRVLNNLDRVHPATRERVMCAVQELGFVQNNFAASMITGQTKIILIIVPDFINSFFGAVIQGAEHHLRKHGYLTMVASTDDRKDSQISSILRKLNYAVDGAIIIPTGNPGSDYENFSKPIVFVDRTVPDKQYDSVQVDNFGGVYLLTEELLHAGHRKIGIITGNTYLNIGQERLNGFKQAMNDYHMPIEDRYIASGQFYETDGYQHMLKMLGEPDPPTAVIACNNLICSGCMLAAQELKLVIGRDISLVGFDDHPLASMSHPGITVIDRPTTEMGVVASRILLEHLNSAEVIAPQNITLPVHLVRRDSVYSLT